MKHKKRIILSKKAMSWRWLIIVFLAILLGIIVFTIITRWANVFAR